MTAWLTSPKARSSCTDWPSSRVRASTFFSQIVIGILQPAAHVVELIGQGFELIARLDGDTLAEIAAANPRRSCL